MNKPIPFSIPTESDRNSLAFFLTVRNLSNIRRLPNYRFNSHYSVAEHSYYTALLTFLIGSEVFSQDYVQEAVFEALLHDLPECLGGDIVYPVKRELKQNCPQLLEKLDDHIMGLLFELLGNENTTRIWGDLVKRSNPLVKFCDMLELAIFVYEEQQSNLTMKIAVLADGKTLLQRCTDILSDTCFADIRLSPLASRLLNMLISGQHVTALFL